MQLIIDGGAVRAQVRKIRYSTKQKKELIKERRRRQREASAADAAPDGEEPDGTAGGQGPEGAPAESSPWRSRCATAPHLLSPTSPYFCCAVRPAPPSAASAHSFVTSPPPLMCCLLNSVKGGRAQGAGLGVVGWHHRETQENTAPLDFAQDHSLVAVDDGNVLGLLASVAEAGHSPEAHVDIPCRPDWQVGCSLSQLLRALWCPLPARRADLCAVCSPAAAARAGARVICRGAAPIGGGGL